jgi:hypothetical protein
MTPCSEFNFFMDPEAAQVVLNNLSPCPMVILPLETCMKFATSQKVSSLIKIKQIANPTLAVVTHFEDLSIFKSFDKEWRVNVLGNLKTLEIKFLNKIESSTLKGKNENWAACSAALTACLIDHSVRICIIPRIPTLLVKRKCKETDFFNSH